MTRMGQRQGAAASYDTICRAAVLCAVALMLVASQATMARLSPGWAQANLKEIPDALPVVLLLGLPALAGLAVSSMLARVSTTWLTLATVTGTGLAMRYVWLGVPVTIDDDFWRYLWDGAVLANGHNPYAISPKAALDGIGVPAALAPLAAQATEVLKGVNFPHLTTIYPGTAQLGFALASLIAPLKLDGLRIAFLLADLAAFGVLAAILRELGRSPHLAALYWLNPLVVYSGYGTVHSEILLAPALLAACLAAWRGRDVLAALLLAAAVGVKIWPVLLVPLFAHLVYARGRSLILPGVAFTLACALLLGPLAVSALNGSRSGLVAYSDFWFVNNGPFSWVSYWIYEATDGNRDVQRVLRAIIAAGTGLFALYIARREPRDLRDFLTMATIIAAATFYAAPAQFPWYGLWFLPLAAALEWRALLLASATLAIYYINHPLMNQGIGHVHHYGWAFLHALPVWIWLVWEAWQRRAPRQPVTA